MTETTRSGGSGLGAVLGVLGLVAAVSVGAIALGSGTPAGATGLEQFDSCAELEAWSGEVLTPDTTIAQFGDEADRDASSDDGAAAPALPSEDAGEEVAPEAAEATTALDTGSNDAEGSDAAGTGAGNDTGGTNTVVEGVDEIDIIDRVGDDRLLVSRNGALALVDLTGRTIVAELDGLPWDARVSVAGDLIWVAGTSNDGLGTEVRRVRLDGDTFVDDGTWTTPGYLLDARRTGDELHVVAVDQPQPGILPFEDGPVPCDQVWRPVDPATTPAATLVATLPATGALEPTAAAAVTGSGGNLLVTNEAVYVATESWDDNGTVTTGLHRFDLADLTPTGSGEVPGSVAGRFALNEHEGTLRVATNAGSGFGFGRGIPIEGDAFIEDTPTAAVPEEGPGALAEVFTFDTDGDLDLLGRSGLFGHDGETIQGVRFIGDIAYVVTFLQTDPFWVVDLADPAAPTVVGELAIPGFSGYLHPAGDGRVVGFGPDGSGAMAARLFDVSDPSAPSVIDEIVLGQDSPVAYDHHAFVGIAEGRFAVPFTDYPEYREVTDCDQPIPLPQPTDPIPVDPGIGDGTGGSSGSIDPGIAVGEVPPAFYCEPVPVGGETGAVVLEITDGRLSVAERASVSSTDVYAERVVADADGNWLLLSWDRLVATDDGTEIVLPAGEGGGIIID